LAEANVVALAPKLLYEADGWIGHIRMSPKGTAIALIDHPQLGDDGGSLAMVDLAGKKMTLSTGWDSIQGVAWSPGGDEIWFTATRTGGDRSLYAVTPSGSVRLLARVPGELTLLDVGRDGNVLLTRGNDRAGMTARPVVRHLETLPNPATKGLRFRRRSKPGNKLHPGAFAYPQRATRYGATRPDMGVRIRLVWSGSLRQFEVHSKRAAEGIRVSNDNRQSEYVDVQDRTQWGERASDTGCAI
jgi:hypothetical protein